MYDYYPATWFADLAEVAEYVFDNKHDGYPVAVHVFLVDEASRILLMRRAGSFTPVSV